MIHLDYLVTGTGRCGTVYMARLLTSLGIMCGHEAIFDQTGLDAAEQRMRSPSDLQTSWCSRADALRGEWLAPWFDPRLVRAESSYLAAPFIASTALAGAAVVHVVRNPLLVVSSLRDDVHLFADGLHFFAGYRDFVQRFIGDVMHLPTEVERAILYWIEWNEMIERNCAGREYLRFRVETQCSDELLDFLRVPSSMRAQPAYANSATNSWKRRDRDVVLADVPAGALRDRLVETARRYGYPL